ncbi:MAG: NAD-dependent epimerase/dehydratase family protein [Phycisphaerales bacterium]|nr:NAD-dependent epimerase/dehydratase family protein [Phycisphaerales bacterium]
MRVLITGIAGFIGAHTAIRLLARGDSVIGVDALDPPETRLLKRHRLRHIRSTAGDTAFQFHKADLGDTGVVEDLFRRNHIDRVVHLAAAAGNRESAEDPHTYARSNLLGTLNILEGCRHHGVAHLVYASSSSVYGSNGPLPFSPHVGGDHPLTFYAASKRSTELMTHSYAHLFGLPCTGLRFFTVYGPWGRPDMALCRFTKAILEDRPIDVFNYGRHSRDFTYIDDIVDGIVLALDQIPVADPSFDPCHPDPCTSGAPWRVYNIGSGDPVDLMRFIKLIEARLGRKAICNMLPMQPGDLAATCADTTDLERDFGWKPKTRIEDGIVRFVDWYLDYHGLEPAVGAITAQAAT